MFLLYEVLLLRRRELHLRSTIVVDCREPSVIIIITIHNYLIIARTPEKGVDLNRSSGVYR